MPTLSEATQLPNPQMVERVGASPATALTPPPVVNPDTLYSIRSNVNLRCPTPPINVSPDNLRQYYRGGQAPQYRVLSPPTLTSQAAAVGGASVTTVVSGTGSTIPPIVTSPAAQTLGLVTPALTVGQVYPTVVQLAKGFICMGVGVNASSRIRMYKTAATQAADLSRSLIQPVPIGIMHGTICDLALVNLTEFAWIDSPDFLGSNGDSPQTTSTYITITNLGASTAAIAVTINFVPTVS